jgi:electron transport complex protein RnfG
MMKNLLLSVLMMNAVTAVNAQEVMVKEKDGTYIVNTTSLAQDVEGYNGPTPVEIHIQKNKIVKVVALKSAETPKYNARVKKDMLPKYEGMNVKQGTVADVDAVTGATFTSDAIKENVKRGVAYYKAHK